MVISWGGLGSEKNFTAHKCVNEVSYAVFPGGAEIEHRFQLCPIRKASWRSGGMQHEMRKKAFGELSGISGKMRFECVDIGERLAGGEFSRCINRLSDKIGVWMAGRVDSGDLVSALHPAITVPPCAHHVETLHRESHGIKLRVA